MMNTKELLQCIIGVGVLSGMIVGGISYFAKAYDVELVEMRLDQKIITDQVQQTQQRVWQLEDRYGERPVITWPDVDDKKEYRRLKESLDVLKQKRDVLLKEIK